MGDILKTIFSNDQVKYLIVLVAVNLILGVTASIKNRDFKFSAVGDWLFERVFPLLVGYGSAALLAWANPDLEIVKTAAFGTLTIAMLGYVAANLKDFGVNLPDAIAGKRP